MIQRYICIIKVWAKETREPSAQKTWPQSEPSSTPNCLHARREKVDVLLLKWSTLARSVEILVNSWGMSDGAIHIATVGQILLAEIQRDLHDIGCVADHPHRLHACRLQLAT